MYDYNADAKILWDYHHISQPVSRQDCILAFGSHDLHVAERAAELFQQGYGDYILFTGGLGRITKNIWRKTEAEKYSDVALEMGVPVDRILLETKSTNTGENIRFTRKLIEDRNYHFQTFLVVDKPFKERRIFATLKKQWDDMNFIVTSPQYTYEEYKEYYKKSNGVTVEEFISIMVGDLQRIDLYGKNGFQIPQEIPEYVMAAYQRLVNYGFTDQLIKS